MSDIVERLRQRADKMATRGNAEALREAADELERLRAENAELRADAERLAYLYSGQKTSSDALVELELRLLNGDTITLDEARAAIDAARIAQKTGG